MKEIVEIVGSIERERYRNGDFCIATMRVSEVRQGVLKRANDLPKPFLTLGKMQGGLFA